MMTKSLPQKMSQSWQHKDTVTSGLIYTSVYVYRIEHLDELIESEDDTVDDEVGSSGNILDTTGIL